MTYKKLFLAGVALAGLCGYYPQPALAEDCTGVLPGSDCTLDEDTTAPLTIDSGQTLTVGASVTIDETINGDDADGDGTIQTNSGGVSVNQTAVIGGDFKIDNLVIGNTDQWTTSADILTNNNGSDIDLGSGDGGEILNLNGGLTIEGEIDGNVGDILNIGNNGQGGTFTLDGQVETVEFNVVSGNVTAQGSLGSGLALSSISVADGALLTLTESATTSGALNIDGGITIGAGNTLSANTYTTNADTGNIVIRLNRSDGTLDTGAMSISAGGPVDLSNDTLEFRVELGSDVLVSETVTGIITGNGGPTVLPALVDDSFLFDYDISQSGNNVDLEITRQSLDAVADNGNNRIMSNRLLSELSASEDEVIQAIHLNLSSASTRQSYNETLESTLPAVDKGAAAVSYYATNKTIELTRIRVAELRNSTSSASGVSSGNDYRLGAERGVRLWVKAFGGVGEQSDRDGIDGYEMDTVGMTAGADTGKLHDDWVLGIAGTFADTDLESSNANETSTQINSYLLTLYNTYEFEKSFISSSATWGINDVSSVRRNVGGTNNIANAEYDNEQLTLFAEYGRDYRTGNMTFTPSFTAQYSYLETENYRERGAGGANLNVNTNSLHALEVGPRLRASTMYVNRMGMFVTPEINLGYKYDLIGDKEKNVTVLGAGGTEMTLEGFSTQDHTLEAGTGVTFQEKSWEVKAHYNYEMQGDLSIHSGFLRGAYKF